MIDDLGGELDFYALAEELPQQQDLLDEQDDAPIIRLINAFTERGDQRTRLRYPHRNLRERAGIRFRIDGSAAADFGAAAQAGGAAGVAHRVMSKLDIAE